MSGAIDGWNTAQTSSENSSAQTIEQCKISQQDWSKAKITMDRVMNPSSNPPTIRKKKAKRQLNDDKHEIANNDESSGATTWPTNLELCLSVIGNENKRLVIFSRGKTVEIPWSQFGNLMFMLRGLESQTIALEQLSSWSFNHQ